ncbi:MAG: protein TolR [Rhodoferax sp.]|nr:protein TolR [Rhodoferax sp.]
MPATVSRGRGRRTINEINMVPFIDVMLVLLIIFMVTAPLITPSLIDLPSMGKAPRQPDLVIEVVISKTGSLELKLREKKSSVTLDMLVTEIRRAQADTPNSAVVISADKNVKYEIVMKVMDKLQRAGVQRLGLSVQLVK